jgi:hypothetical protein
VIGPEQLAFEEKRVIHEGHLIINKVKKKVKGLMACIDFKGAFDYICHEFIWQLLEKMGAGENLIGHIKTLYKGAKSPVLNFNTTTYWFDLARSCRQGGPIAPYLFILVMEALLCQIRKLDIGLNLSNQLDTEKFWGSAFADDLTVFARDNDELCKVLGLVQEFRDAAGLVINTDKSEILELGKYKYCAGIGIPLVKMAKITGVWFSEDYQLMSELEACTRQCVWEACTVEKKTAVTHWQISYNQQPTLAYNNVYWECHVNASPMNQELSRGNLQIYLEW